MKTYRFSLTRGLRIVCGLSLVVATLLTANATQAADRFPQPEFESGYSHPETFWPAAPAQWAEWLDVALLAIALVLAVYLAVYRRSRRGIFILSIACLAYFGFYRHGCVCPIGSLQPVTESLTGSPFPLPFGVALLFFLPLLFALFFGRVFCAAVCPLGAIQEIVAVRPGKTSRWLNEVLSFGPYLYLGLTVLLAATGTTYFVCRTDPFVAIFRLAGSSVFFFVGGGLLLLGIVFARPYCRVLCPYGVLLRWFSMLSWRHVTVTPDTCIECRLCENSCPVEAIRPPPPQRPAETVSRGARRLAWSLLATPVVLILAIWLGKATAPNLARLNGQTQLLERLDQEALHNLPPTAETEAFRSGTITPEQLRENVRQLRERLRRGGYWLGAFLGMVLIAKLFGASIRPGHTGYVPDRGSCLSCARCYASCPREHVRRKEKEA